MREGRKKDGLWQGWHARGHRPSPLSQPSFVNKVVLAHSPAHLFACHRRLLPTTTHSGMLVPEVVQLALLRRFTNSISEDI